MKRRSIMTVKNQRKGISGALNAVPFSWVFAGIIVVLGAAFWYMSGSEAGVQAPSVYTADEIEHARPFRAVHEMTGSRPIRFLPKDQPQPKIASWSATRARRR
jgi:hypothetical protein